MRWQNRFAGGPCRGAADAGGVEGTDQQEATVKGRAGDAEVLADCPRKATNFLTPVLGPRTSI